MEASTFGQWLKQRRHELDLTQEAVAEATGCSPDTVRKIESGHRRPSRQIADLLMAVLQVDPEAQSAFVLWARGVGGQPILSGKFVGQGTVKDIQPTKGPAAGGEALGSRGRRASRSLPSLPTALIGRERDLAQAKALLWQSSTRLMTLVGPPGVGKTSLSIALAAAVEADFKDGLIYVPLGPVSGPELVAVTIAEEIGVGAGVKRPIQDVLQDALQGKQLLLVLDNFEHLLPAAPLVSGLLAANPQLKIVVTSRSPLHLRGEKLQRVAPLDVPEMGQSASIEDLSDVGSVALFLERVRDINSEFEISPENAGTIAAICGRLEGLPLAIELAAARTRLLSLAALLSRLERPLNILTRGPQDASIHHTTLREALESSYALLSEDNQRLFRKLGIFAGNFTVEAAERVAEATLDGLEAVQDQSLLRLQGHSPVVSEPRLGMLIPVREFAVELLEARGEYGDAALRHVRYFLEMALAADVEMLGPNQKVWLSRMDAAYSDIRTALEWSLKHGQEEIALRLAAATRHFWLSRGYRQEGLRWLEQALEQGKDAPAGARVAALNAMGRLTYRHGDHEKVESYATQALVLSRELGDRSLLADSLLSLALILTEMGAYERGLQHYQESLAISEDTGNKVQTAKALVGLARISSRYGDLAEAIILQERALVIRRQLGMLLEIASCLENLGSLTLRQGDYKRAIAYAEEAMLVSREAGDLENVAFSLGVVGKALLELGENKRSAEAFTESLMLLVKLEGVSRMVAFALEEIARVAMRMGQYKGAAQLFGAGDALRDACKSPVSASYRAEYDQSVTALRQWLGEPAFNAAWTLGRSLSLDEAIDHAKAVSAMQG